MPLELKAVFILFELERMTTTEVAEVLGIPRGTAASRLRRARVGGAPARGGRVGEPGVNSPHRDRSPEENLGLLRQMRDGVFAEVTLHYSEGAFRPWPWTYADYREGPVLAGGAVDRGPPLHIPWRAVVSPPTSHPRGPNAPATAVAVARETSCSRSVWRP